MSKRERTTAHHTLYYGKEWSLRPEGLYLREQPGLIVPLPPKEHDILHKEVHLVPLLGFHALNLVAHNADFNGRFDHDIDELMLQIEKAGNHPKADEIERELGQLSIRSLMKQKDIISHL